MRPTVARLTIVVALLMLTVPLAAEAQQAGIDLSGGLILTTSPVALMGDPIPPILSPGRPRGNMLDFIPGERRFPKRL